MAEITTTPPEVKGAVANHINNQPNQTQTHNLQKEKGDSRSICESVMGSVTWTDDNRGYINCPGRHLHTTNNGPRDCMVYLLPVPSINCFHSGCKQVVREKAMELRNALKSGKTSSKPVRLTAEQKKRIERNNYLRDLGIRARYGKSKLLKENAWTLDQLIQSSPVNPSSVNVEEHWKLLLNCCFQPNDIIWIGERYHSGEVHGKDHFKSRNEWLLEDRCPGPLICPSAFKPGALSRSNENVQVQNWMVVESDVLSKDEVCAIFNWIQNKVGIELKAVVDTGNKSLHGWFAFPPPDIFEELKAVLPELGCDEKTLHPSQPVRLPGYPRGDKYQQLVYLKNSAISQEVRL